MKWMANGIKFGGGFALWVAAFSGQALHASSPSAEQALKLTPVQADVDFERPRETDVSKCSIKAESVDGKTGWVVRGPSGQVLRQFIDSNHDNVVDLWCYYKDGVEVYRDIDGNHNGKADQYRWFNAAGTRWGGDANEDGQIDEWRRISAEEASAEAVAALANHDAHRFQCLLLSAEELKQLGLGSQREKVLAEKIEQAAGEFKSQTRKQKALSAKSTWLQFGGMRPALVPAGTDDSTKDLLVYENVISMVETDGKSSQVLLGTLVRVGDVWRLIDSPSPLDGKSEIAADAPFFQPQRARGGTVASGGIDQKMQELLQKLEKLDEQAARATSEKAQAAIAVERCDVVEKLAAAAATAEDRAQWVRNLAETIGAAVQSGTMPDGIERLKALQEKLAEEKGDEDLAAYTQFRYLTALYNHELQGDPDNFPKVQKRWLKNLKEYVANYPRSADAAEAMLQLGTAEEFAGEEEEAKNWYRKIVENFANSASAAKAAGAITRLDCVGKRLSLKGASLTSGKTVDLAHFRKKVVLIQFWATWCGPCKADMRHIKDALATYGKDGFAVISISLDNHRDDVVAYLKSQSLPWAHVYEKGGLDSRLANELGVLTLPTMLLVDQDGKVVNRSVNASDLNRDVKALLQQTAANRK